MSQKLSFHHKERFSQKQHPPNSPCKHKSQIGRELCLIFESFLSYLALQCLFVVFILFSPKKNKRKRIFRNTKRKKADFSAFLALKKEVGDGIIGFRFRNRSRNATWTRSAVCLSGLTRFGDLFFWSRRLVGLLVGCRRNRIIKSRRDDRNNYGIAELFPSLEN